MIAVIDCGTTNTRIFILDENGVVRAKGEKKIGVRDTSITDSREALKSGVEELYRGVISENGINGGDIRCAVASGMITSEIGLIEIPHLTAPAGINELSSSIEKVFDKRVVDLGVPVYFIRGVKNNYAQDAGIAALRCVDFMRGEEVQCVGIIEQLKPKLPVNIVVFSSHTKLIHIDAQGRISHCLTTISGQLFEALKSSTNVGKSIVTGCEEASGSYCFEDIVSVAADCVEHAGIVRTMLMPRFMEVLLKTTGSERRLFVDAAIAADDMKAFDEFVSQGYAASQYILFGHKERCELYGYLIKQRFGCETDITSVSDKDEIFDLTIKGALATAKAALKI